MFISNYNISCSLPNSSLVKTKNLQRDTPLVVNSLYFTGPGSQTTKSSSSSGLKKIGLKLGITTDPTSVKGIIQIITEQLKKAISKNKPLDDVLVRYMLPAYQKAKDEGTLERYSAVEEGVRKFLDAQKTLTGKNKEYIAPEGRCLYKDWLLPAEKEKADKQRREYPSETIAATGKVDVVSVPKKRSSSVGASPSLSMSSSTKGMMEEWGSKARQRRTADDGAGGQSPSPKGKEIKKANDNSDHSTPSSFTPSLLDLMRKTGVVTPTNKKVDRLTGEELKLDPSDFYTPPVDPSSRQFFKKTPPPITPPTPKRPRLLKRTLSAPGPQEMARVREQKIYDQQTRELFLTEIEKARRERKAGL
jgi:hypothetical protein